METPMDKIQCSNFSSSHVRVALRVRPFLPQEIEKDGSKPVSCVSLLDQVGEEVTVHLKDQMTSRNECYNLDSFFGQGDPIIQIFHKEISSAIPGIFRGHNATVFAYGATGSGKTYTMQGTKDELGLIPLAMSTILSLSKSIQSLVEISYYEVYMDRCYDLLEPKAKEIMALEDKNGRVQLKGLSLVPVSSLDKFHEIFSIGVQRRKVAHTGLNDCSSRSHAVLVIAVRNGGVKGKLNLIDLAGNEDNRRTCNEGIRLQESAKINQSLFALSNVIYALNNNEARIPFRESKLTRILQDSLGGDSRAFMIACLNPRSYQEAVHTVSLAARSRQIVNHFGSVRRKETLNKTVDMETKLRAWLESKGKTKSILRMNGLCSPLRRNPTSVSYSKNLESNHTSIKDAESLSLTSKGRKLFDSEALVSPCAVIANEHQQHDETCIDGKVDDKTNFSKNMNQRKQELHYPHQKVLSPTKETNNKLPDENNPFFAVQDAKTPLSLASQRNYFESSSTLIDRFKESLVEDAKTPLSLASQRNDFETSSTLIDRFKESLVEEYISFLNVASKEELMLLKGIGQKRAESILELRKSSPKLLKSLSDLKKIGLSSRQVQNLLRGGARGIFT